MSGHDTNRSDEERAYYLLQKRAWSILAPLYDAATFIPLRKLRRLVADIVLPEADLLDVATGTGGQARFFAARARDVVGVDLSDAMLRVARRKNRAHNVRFERADAVALPFGAGRFDAACISFALHEMPAGVRRRALAEIVRVTKPGAQVIIVDYGLPRSRLARGLVVRIVRTYEGRHYVEFLAEDLRGILEDAGIRVDREWSALGGVARVVTGHRTGSRLS